MEEILDNWTFDEEEQKRLKFYKDFVALDDAKEFLKLLYDHDIPYSAEVPELLIDQAIVGTGMLPLAIVKLLPEDFKRANALLESQLADASYADVEEHYLNQLSDAELLAIFEKPDEWSVEDAAVAKIILRERGVGPSDEAIRQMRDARMAEIQHGRKGNRLMMLFYFLSIILVIVVHPIFFVAGVGMGYYYGYGTSVDPDGNRHFVFEPQTRFYGKVILYGGIAVLIVELLILFHIF